MKFLTCLDSEVTSITPTKGTSVDPITISGSGFGTTDSCVTVEVGKKTCTISSITDTEIVCTINPGSDMQTGQSHYVRVFVHNNGYAQNKQGTNFAFGLSPHISSISPASGSLGGNVKVTVSGKGFTSGNIEVKIGFSPCEVVSVTYSEVVCIAPQQSSASTEEVTITVQNYPATCKINSGCNFEYAEALTPKITAINPVSGTGTNITITGENLGTDKTKLSLKVGDTDCLIQDGITNTQAECFLVSSAAGDNALTLENTDSGAGIVASGVVFAGVPTLSSVTPTTGSVAGGTLLTLSGNGFTPDISISMAYQSCNIRSISQTQVTCVTPPYFTAEADIQITAGSITFPVIKFQYTDAATPTITSISPQTGSAGNNIVISGTGFDTNNSGNKVTVGDKDCTVSSSTATQISCTTDASLSGGSHPVVVDVTGKGSTNNNTLFTITFAISGINPADGSIAGGQKVTISGSGFTTTATVTICNNPCEVITATSSQVVCTTPASDGAKQCPVVLFTGTNQLQSTYDYSAAKTPTITSIQPRRGGTAGGTPVTITGTGFGSTQADATVSFNGITWSIESFSSTQIVARTAPVNKPVGPERTGRGRVVVDINEIGHADKVSRVLFIAYMII